MYVVASEAALLLKIPHRRLLELLRSKRVKGAYKSGRYWLIPLYNGLPCIIPGQRGRKGNWEKARLPKKTIIHINRNHIKENLKKSPLERKPVIAVKGTTKFYAHELEIPFPCRIVYQPDKPLNCHASLWIEILGENLDKVQPPSNIVTYNRDIFRSSSDRERQ
jgi:hypothetical protein